jgi:hypothetical protein
MTTFVFVLVAGTKPVAKRPVMSSPEQISGSKAAGCYTAGTMLRLLHCRAEQLGCTCTTNQILGRLLIGRLLSWPAIAGYYIAGVIHNTNYN